jgi:hypothetical protein
MSSLYGTPESVPDMPLTRTELTPTTTERQTEERVRTLTTSCPYPKAELILSQISRYERQKATARSQGTQTTRSKLTDPRSLLSEADCSQLLREFFQAQGWEYREEYEIKGSFNRIDFLVKAPHEGGHIFFGVECKKDLNKDTNVTVLADYLEQAAAYSKALDMPVFLGPVLDGGMVTALSAGGHSVNALNSLCIFGGRFNVGLLSNQMYVWGYGHNKDIKYGLVLRGSYFWSRESGFNSKRLSMACSTGSKKERKPLKVWK